VWGLSSPLMGRTERILYTFFARADSIRIDSVESFTNFMTQTFMKLAMIMAIPFGMFMIVALASTLMQTGFVFTTQKIGFDFNRLNPLTGFNRMFSQQSFVDLAKNILKLAVVGSIVMLVIFPRFRGLERLPMIETSGILSYMHDLLSRLMIAIAVLVTLIAG